MYLIISPLQTLKPVAFKTMDVFSYNCNANIIINKINDNSLLLNGSPYSSFHDYLKYSLHSLL